MANEDKGFIFGDTDAVDALISVAHIKKYCHADIPELEALRDDLIERVKRSQVIVSHADLSEEDWYKQNEANRLLEETRTDDDTTASS